MAHQAATPTNSPCLPINPMPWTSVRTSFRQAPSTAYSGKHIVLVAGSKPQRQWASIIGRTFLFPRGRGGLAATVDFQPQFKCVLKRTAMLFRNVYDASSCKQRQFLSTCLFGRLQEELLCHSDFMRLDLRSSSAD